MKTMKKFMGNLLSLPLAGAWMMALLLPLMVVAVGSKPAHARVEIDVTRGNIDPLKIAIPLFLGNSQLSRNISGVVEADLRRSGLFAPIDRAAHIQKITNSIPRRNFPVGLQSGHRRW